MDRGWNEMSYNRFERLDDHKRLAQEYRCYRYMGHQRKSRIKNIESHGEKAAMRLRKQED